jgi:hypothetical protein
MGSVPPVLSLRRIVSAQPFVRISLRIGAALAVAAVAVCPKRDETGRLNVTGATTASTSARNRVGFSNAYLPVRKWMLGDWNDHRPLSD